MTLAKDQSLNYEVVALVADDPGREIVHRLEVVLPAGSGLTEIDQSNNTVEDESIIETSEEFIFKNGFEPPGL